MNGKQESSMKVLIPILACLLLVTVPFLICDLYYAYNDNSKCLDQKLKNYSINFTLRTWLFVDGYTTLALLILIFLTIFAAYISPNLGGTLAFFTMSFGLLHGVFKLAWLIVGSIMFWGQLNPAHSCKSSLNDYMWAMLIISFIGSCMNFTLSNRSKQS